MSTATRARRRRHAVQQTWTVGGCIVAAGVLLATVAVGADQTSVEEVAAAPLATSSPRSVTSTGAPPEFAPASDPQAARAAVPDDPTEAGGQSTSPTPTPAATPGPPGPSNSPSPWPELDRVVPERVEIPSVGIASDLVTLGLNPDGSLEVPAEYDLAGWYADGPWPGDRDAPPAVVVGHVDSTSGPAVFYRIRELAPGDRVRIVRADGSMLVFRVRDATQYPKSELPTDEVYARRGVAELVLITCSGEFDREARSYLDNFVVTATLDRAATATT